MQRHNACQLTQADCTSGVGDGCFDYLPVSVGEGRKACASAAVPPGQRILTVSCSSMTVPLQRPLAQSVQLLLFCGVGQDEILGCFLLASPCYPWSGVRASCYLVHSSRRPSPPASDPHHRQRAWTVSSVTPLGLVFMGICLRLWWMQSSVSLSSFLGLACTCSSEITVTSPSPPYSCR